MTEENGQRPLRQRVAESLVPPETVERAIAAGLEQHREAVAAELIGRTTIATGQASFYKSRARARTVDETVPDYEFWDRLRRGKARGYTLGGLFSGRIEQIFASWVLGRGVEVALKEAGPDDAPDDPRNYTNEQLAEFVGSLFEAPDGGDEGDDDEADALLVQVYKDHLGLGDQYVIVNADGSLSVPSPDTVDVERHPLDYRRVTAVEVTTKLPAATIVDRYEAERRTVTIRERQENGGMRETVSEFPNMIGRIPVVSFHHGRSANETNGHPIHEPLRPLYDQYDDTIYKQLDGAKLLGNPLLAFVGMEDIDAVVNANDPAEQDTYTDKDGNTATRTQLTIDQNAVLMVGKGGDAKFVAPPTGFTEDTKTALKTLFLLLLDHTGIPEFVWGNEMSSSRSSAEVQLTQWVRDVELRQRVIAGPLRRLCKLWLMVRSLVDPRIVVDALEATFPPLVEEDEEIKLKRLAFAKDRNLITDATALAQLHLVEDPVVEVEAAQAEADARREEMFPDGDTAMFQQRLQRDGQDEREEDA